MSKEAEQHDELQELMRQAQAGDHAAYGRLLHAVTPLLRGFIRNRLGATSEAEDILQEILIAVHQSGHTYQPNRPFRPWLFAVANYKVQDHLRQIYRGRRDKTVPLEDVENNLSQDVTSRGEAREILNETIKTLPERQQEIVTLLKIEGYSHAEVAKKTGMSVPAVKVAAHRAYKKLEKNAKEWT